MKKFVALTLLALTLGCAHNPPASTDPTRNLSAAGHAAYNTTKIIKALDVLRDVAAEGEKQNPKVVSAKMALRVLAYHKQVVETMSAVPNGWKAVATSGLTLIEDDLSADERAALGPFITLLKSLYAAFVPTTASRVYGVDELHAKLYNFEGVK